MVYALVIERMSDEERRQFDLQLQGPPDSDVARQERARRNTEALDSIAAAFAIANDPEAE